MKEKDLRNVNFVEITLSMKGQDIMKKCMSCPPELLRYHQTILATDVLSRFKYDRASYINYRHQKVFSEVLTEERDLQILPLNSKTDGDVIHGLTLHIGNATLSVNSSRYLSRSLYNDRDFPIDISELQ